MTTEAAKCVAKKKSFDKSKLKRTIKNVLCKPDKDIWPEISPQQSSNLGSILIKHKTDVPQFTKLPWSVLKDIPKSQRPKEKKPLVPGFRCGMSDCTRTIESGGCAGVVLDSAISPRFIVSHIVHSATEHNIPIVCMVGLKQITQKCFGFPTSCLILTKDECNKDVREKVQDLWKSFDFGDKAKLDVESEVEENEKIESNNEETTNKNEAIQRKPFQYLTRVDKHCRAFVPPDVDVIKTKDFSGQNFIKVAKADPKDAKKKPVYKGMIVKKFCNNPNRKNKKQKKKGLDKK